MCSCVSARSAFFDQLCLLGFFSFGVFSLILILAIVTGKIEGLADFRFGSKADICSAKRHVR